MKINHTVIVFSRKELVFTELMLLNISTKEPILIINHLEHHSIDTRVAHFSGNHGVTDYDLHAFLSVEWMMLITPAQSTSCSAKKER